MTKTNLRSLGMLVVMAAVAMPLVGCKKASKDRRSKRTVNAKIADFDPGADMVLDLDKWGTQRPDDWMMQQALNATFEEMDKCVADTKDRNNMGDTSQLPGGVTVAIKVVGNQAHPEAVNVALTNKKMDRDEKLVGCIHDAVTDNYRIKAYDGPPVIMESEIDELDPGSEEEDFW